ncbi:MAG TPA: LptE family protein [Bacteroidales bacterium]|nr:LptE family protein [Bacteroidales bacterium]HPF02329.1 LptE family protein [Bacteroidales bacterium]HPJ58174.1 LptE family protein [Bacteroidales bacterium]HPR11505.1 LptE family protein [Bacteroidales bacterium]HRW84247.1 LptE family protein [Bacteroidales bacterium]
MALKCNSAIRVFTGILPYLLLALVPVLNGCKITYSFTGASISPDVKTLSVQYFENRANLVQPGLSQKLTDALIDKCKAQTNLGVINGVGDVNFEGEISDYNTRPLTVGADAQAATNRFTISVRVRFTNVVQPEFSYEQTFSRYEDYSSDLDLSAVEVSLSEKIIELLVEDIFNKAFVNW